MLCRAVEYSCWAGVRRQQALQKTYLMSSALLGCVSAYRQTPAWDIVRVMFLPGRNEPLLYERQFSVRLNRRFAPMSCEAVLPSAAYTAFLLPRPVVSAGRRMWAKAKFLRRWAIAFASLFELLRG